MFIAALLLTVITKKNPSVQENRRMNNVMVISYYRENYTEIKHNNRYTDKKMNPTNIMLSGRSQIQESLY